MAFRIFLPQRTLAITAVVLGAAAIPGTVELLQYRRQAVLQGELWRLLTCHLVHASAPHLVWDVLPLLVLGLLFERTLGRGFWPVLGFSSVIVGAGLVVLDPRLAVYCGLSGVLNGIWVAGALTAAREEREAGNRALSLLYWACVAGDLAKVAFETATGSPIFTDPAELGALPVPLAHVLGALAGTVSARWPAGKRQRLRVPSLTRGRGGPRSRVRPHRGRRYEDRWSPSRSSPRCRRAASPPGSSIRSFGPRAAPWK